MKARKNTTTAKGYRLKPQTHKLVKKIQKKLNGSQEEVISEALRTYCVNLINENYKKTNNFQEDVS